MTINIRFIVERTHLSERNHRRAMNRANRTAMTWLLRKVVSLKFSPRAFREFPGVFRQRSTKHRLRKQRQFGHNLPLVFTGTLRSNVMSRSKIRATYKGASITLRFGHPMREEQVQEMEALSERHERELSQRVEKEYAQLSQDRRFLTRKTYRSRR